mgnify:CR=1 FL=1
MHPTAAPGVQLDLFADSRSVTLANDVVAALLARDEDSASAALAALSADDPQADSLPHFDVLVRALVAVRATPADAPSIAAMAERIDREAAPVAQRVLGAAAGDFIRGLFADLAEAARQLPFDPDWPQAHRASLCLRCGLWAEAEEAARSIPAATTRADPLHWLTVAAYRQRGLDAARPQLFALAWRAPQRIAATLRELDDASLDRDWRRFAAASPWESVADADLPTWFPAWYLLEHPMAGADLDFIDAPESPPAEAARLLRHIAGLERRGDWRAQAAQREKLRALNAELFALFMAQRSVARR